MPPKLPFQKLIGPLVALLMVLTMLLATATPVLADDDPPKPVPGLGKVSNADLTSMYQKLRSWYDSQYTVIRESYELAAWFQTLIDFYKGKGRDVTRLEIALSTFYGEISAAEAARVNTNAIFSRNAGFNGYYVILDRQLAAQTILDARSNLKGTHLNLLQAVKELAQSYHGWKEWLLKTH